MITVLHMPDELQLLAEPDASGSPFMARRRLRPRSKYRAAAVVRTCALIFIPLLYFILNGRTTSQEQFLNNMSGRGEDVLVSRRLLSTVGQGEKSSGYRRLVGMAVVNNCTPPAILEFPSDGLTRMQRKSGFVAVHCVLAVYCCLLLATVCEDYFVPAIELLCARLHMSSDVAGATLMAAASSSPELFISCVGTFVTEGDLGVGAIVGSAVFNVLAVPACCALLAPRVVELDRWAVSRDCLVYALAVVALVLTLHDNVVHWYEALALVSLYSLYILGMVFNRRLGKLVRGGCGYMRKPNLYSEISPLLLNGKCGDGHLPTDRRDYNSDRDIAHNKRPTDSESGGWDFDSPLRWPGTETSYVRKALWACAWPVSAVLWATVPDCRRRPVFSPLTFVLCVLWIGLASYLLAWIITILGDTLDVPDSVTGLTVLAAGTSLPEAVSSVLVTNRGHGTMGLSNAIGSNTFDVLLCLGLPWLVKSLCFPATPGNFSIRINSGGLRYVTAALLCTLALLYTVLACSGFRAGRGAGATCALAYLTFLALAALLELNVLLQVNPPVCAH